MKEKSPKSANSDKASDETTSKSLNPKKDYRNLIIISLSILALFGIGAAAYLYSQNKQHQSDIDDMEVQITSLNTQIAKLQNENVEEDLEGGSCQQEGENCGGMPTAEGSFIECCSGLVCDYSNVDPNVADAPGRCVVDEDENSPQDNGGSAIDKEREEFHKYIIFNREVVERELPEGAPIFAWDVIRTFDIDDPVEKLYVNPSETHFVYGVYKSDAIYGDGMPGETWYSWFLYNISTGDISELTGLEFENFDIEGDILKVNSVYGWISDKEISLGDSGMYDLNGVAIYSVDTKQFTPYSQMEWDKYETVGY